MNPKNVVNLTPHAIVLCTQDGTVIATFPPSGAQARVAQSFESNAVIGVVVPSPSPEADEEAMKKVVPVQLVSSKWGPVTGLPARQDDTILIVSSMVLDHPDLAGRWDVVAPGRTLRDAGGNITGCFELRQRSDEV